MIAEVLTDVSEAEWRAFLAETPGASIFQSPDLMRVYRKTEGYRPNVVAVESVVWQAISSWGVAS